MTESSNIHNDLTRTTLQTKTSSYVDVIFFSSNYKLQLFIPQVFFELKLTFGCPGQNGQLVERFGISRIHGLRTPNDGINQKYLKNWADVADKICFGRT